MFNLTPTLKWLGDVKLRVHVRGVVDGDALGAVRVPRAFGGTHDARRAAHGVARETRVHDTSLVGHIGPGGDDDAASDARRIHA